MTSQRTVAPGSLGVWLLKVDPAGTGAEELLAGGPRHVTRCVRRSYRTSLMEPGQPVLLWVSGRDPRIPAGVHARGRIAGPVRETADDDERRLEVALRLERLERPLLRGELLADPVLSRIEVIRMPAGSNPSYLTVEEVARLELLVSAAGASRLPDHG